MSSKYFLLPLALAAGIHAQANNSATLDPDPRYGLRIVNSSGTLRTYVHQGGVNLSLAGPADGSGVITPEGYGLRIATLHTFVNLGSATSNWLQLRSNLATFSGDVKVPGKLLIGTTGWSIKAPDFVFAPGYKLQPLSEVEAYVKTNRHLPGIASASEMEAGKSVDLVQMNLDLLKKVEELTLHVIEQNKKIEAIQKTTGSKI